MLRFARAQRLWQPGDGILVAVSGGPDSVALLSLLIELAGAERLCLGVAHFDHRTRASASARDARFVEALAKKHSLPFYLSRCQEAPRRNREARYRDLRYAFFQQTALRHGYKHIAVAHQADDQAETFLLRLLRGSGHLGLTAMRPREGRVIRPLLTLARSELLAYLASQGRTYRSDASNADQTFLRNRVRHSLLPLLEQDFQPAIRTILARTASQLQEERSLLSCPLQPLPVIFGPGTRAFSAAALLDLDQAGVHFSLRFLLRDLLGAPPSAKLLAELVKLIRSPKAKTQTAAFPGLKVTRQGDIVTLQNTHFSA